MKTFKLTSETDPRCIEFYDKAFPELSQSERHKLRDNWISNNIKNKLNMSKVTQKERVLTAMRNHGSISPWYAINHLGNTRLSATIFQLKKDGHVINSTIERGINKFGDEIRFSRYTLVKEKVSD